MMKLERINDERININNMKNMRIVYMIQTLGIITILGYDFITQGVEGIKLNPLWLVFILSTIILAFLSLRADEHLVLKNLQMLRIAYSAQVLGIISILGYDLVTKGMDGMKANPLWILFIVATTILAFLSMNNSVEQENDEKGASKGLLISFVSLLLICTVVGIITTLSKGYTLMDGILTGGVFFICGFVPFLFLYHFRKRSIAE